MSIFAIDVTANKFITKEELRMLINGPPADGKCHCCGRHISELEPERRSEEEKSEYFFLFDAEGRLLNKNFRRCGPYVAEAERAVNEAEEHLANTGDKGKDPLEWMIKKYGKEKGKDLYFSKMAYDQIRSSWECNDCLRLGLDEYWEKYYKRFT